MHREYPLSLLIITVIILGSCHENIPAYEKPDVLSLRTRFVGDRTINIPSLLGDPWGAFAVDLINDYHEDSQFVLYPPYSVHISLLITHSSYPSLIRHYEVEKTFADTSAILEPRDAIRLALINYPVTDDNGKQWNSMRMSVYKHVLNFQGTIRIPEIGVNGVVIHIPQYQLTLEYFNP